MEKTPDWYGEMKKFVCDMRTTYAVGRACNPPSQAYYRSLEELAYLAQQGNTCGSDEVLSS